MKAITLVIGGDEAVTSKQLRVRKAALEVQIKKVAEDERKALCRLFDILCLTYGLEVDWSRIHAIACDLTDLSKPEIQAKIDRLRRLLADLSPKLRIEPHAAFLTPLAGLLSALGWLALGAVLLMMLATAAVVVLAARGAHDSHRGTIDVLHLMGSTDVQIARLFQRRIGLDALMGGALGFAFAILVILLIGLRLAATGSDLLAAIALPMRDWLILVALPIAGVLLATLTARWTVLRALGRSL